MARAERKAAVNQTGVNSAGSTGKSIVASFRQSSLLASRLAGIK
jgi:hypothetical protein